MDKDMKLFRSIVLLAALLAQTFPSFAGGQGQKEEGCSMECCAWLAAAGMECCDCAETLPPAAPAQAPPAKGRDLMAQVVWLESPDTAPEARLSQALEPKRGGKLQHVQAKPPRVRLPVLFCSFLN